MITKNKIKIYKKYSGNIENWDRFGKRKDKDVLEYDEWELIDELVDNLKLVKNGLASKNFENLTLKKLEASCDNIFTQEEIKSLR